MLSGKIYNTGYYAHHRSAYHGWGVRCGEDLVRRFQARSVADFGCGIGSYLRGAMLAGLDPHCLWGCDGNVDFSARFMHPLVFSCVEKHDLTMPLKITKRDVALCVEVVEHLPESAGETLCTTVANATGRVLIWSAAVPGQGGEGHINEQPSEHWERKFWGRGLRVSEHESIALREAWKDLGAEWWIYRNVRVFRRKGT